MADYTTIDDPSAHFQTKIYTGDGTSSRNLTNDGNSDLKPDLMWVKNRNDTDEHIISNSSIGWDAPKGVGYPWESGPFGGQMSTSSTNGESVPTATYGYVSAALDDGFTVAAGGTNADNCNKNTKEFVAWQWKANGGTKSNNTDGDLTSQVQVNSTAKFSIFHYTGIDPIEPLDIGHGLGAVPEFWIIKARSIAGKHWAVYHKDMHATTPQNYYLRLSSTNAVTSASTWWRNEAPTSTIIKTGEQDDINRAAATYGGYAWIGVQGYSKFGKYVGTSVSDGPYVYLGFQPAWVMIKRLDQGTDYSSWAIFDNQRRAYNPAGDTQSLYANRNYAEGKRGQGSSNSQEVRIDMLSNGFKVRDGGSDEINDANDTYIYAAFAHHPFVTSTDTNSIPTTAR